MKNILLLVLCIVSCKNKSDDRNVMKEWAGKTIVFPSIQPMYVIQKYATAVIDSLQEYKIVLYTDSTGCTNCKFRLEIWRKYIRELSNKTVFLFYFHLKSDDEFIHLLESYRFNYPIFIDDKDELNRLNRFPSNPMFQCFLLDKDNKVLAIGNPVRNSQIWELYKQIITGKISDKPPVTTAEPEQAEMELNDLQTGKTSETVFSLKNTGKEPLIIQTINASCGCTVPEWDKQPAATGKSAKIKVRITPEEKGYFNKTITVHCNTETGQILLKINGTVE